MFNFFVMMGNYEDRKVARDEFSWGFISTVSVTDGEKTYETAVKHERYSKGGSMIIVENYDTKSEAEAGHAKWVKTMTAKKLPDKLVDCCNAGIAQLCKAFGSKQLEQKRRPARKRVPVGPRAKDARKAV